VTLVVAWIWTERPRARLAPARAGARLAALGLCVGLAPAILPAPAVAATSATTAAAPSITGPLSPGVPAAPVTPTTSSTPTILANSSTAASGSSSLSSSDAIAIVAGAVVILTGIALFIWRDARRRAPVSPAGATADAARLPGSRRVKPRKLSAAERRRRKRGRARR
jgi:hypothetical protein